MALGGDDFYVFEARFCQGVSSELSRASNVRFVFRERGNAGNAEEFKEFFEQARLVGVDPLIDSREAGGAGHRNFYYRVRGAWISVSFLVLLLYRVPYKAALGSGAHTAMGETEEIRMATVLITGTSSGIGLAAALELGRAGHTVYATMRNPSGSPELGRLAASESLPISIHTMDVDSDESVAACFASIRAQGEVVDVLVNNAGIERHGSVEELPMADFRSMMETNYFGALRCIRQVLPQMREDKRGCIINVTSVGGKISSSPLGAYSASKFALEALSEALAQELKPFDVRVAIVQPGIIDTPMARSIENPHQSLYRQGRQLSALFRASLKNPTLPSVVASVIKDIIESGTWKLRHPAGPDAEPFLGWRAAMTDEEWISFNALDAEGFRLRVQNDFGLDLDLPNE